MSSAAAALLGPFVSKKLLPLTIGLIIRFYARSQFPEIRTENY